MNREGLTDFEWWTWLLSVSLSAQNINTRVNFVSLFTENRLRVSYFRHFQSTVGFWNKDLKSRFFHMRLKLKVIFEVYSKSALSLISNNFSALFKIVLSDLTWVFSLWKLLQKKRWMINVIYMPLCDRFRAYTVFGLEWMRVSAQVAQFLAFLLLFSSPFVIFGKKAISDRPIQNSLKE